MVLNFGLKGFDSTTSKSELTKLNRMELNGPGRDGVLINSAHGLGPSFNPK